MAVALLLCASVLRKNKPPRSVVLLAAAILLWTALTALTSTNRTISFYSLARVTAATAVMWLDFAALSSVAITSMYFLLAPAMINSVVAILQATHVWDPFGRNFAEFSRDQIGAFLGNPNDVGMFLVPATIVASALAFSSSRFRIASSVIAVICTLGIVATQTVTALGALAVGLLALIGSVGRRGLTVALISIPLALLAFLSTGRLANVISSATSRNYDALLSGRLPAFAAAWSMFAAHPAVGVGPGCFAQRYFSTKLDNEEHHPMLLQSSNRTTNFGEVHNDQLQLLAEAGVPALLLFYAALFIIFDHSAPNAADLDQRRRFAFLAGRGTAASLFVLTLAQFPLHVTGALTAFLFVSAASIAWRVSPSPP